MELLKARGLLPKFDSNIAVFVLIEDEKLRNASLDLVQKLRDAGHAVDYTFTPAKSDKQFKRAMELKAQYTVRIESDEKGELIAKLKNLSTREEKALPPSAVAAAI